MLLAVLEVLVRKHRIMKPFYLLLMTLPFTQSQLLDETDVHNTDTHWNHVTIRRLIDTRIHNKPNDYETKDNTEQGKNIAREWSGSIDPETDLDAFGRKVCKVTTCRRGQCVFAGCSNPTSCNGGFSFSRCCHSHNHNCWMKQMCTTPIRIGITLQYDVSSIPEFITNRTITKQKTTLKPNR